MGRALGAYDEDELDRPDLNKCPDCGCFFATETCTLCGKICPESMRAGNRAPVKKKKRRNTSGRVQFIPWYHTWPAMIIISLIMPIAGIILFFTSPYSKKVKMIVAAAVVAWQVLIPVLVGVLLPVISEWMDEPPVNDRLSRVEYMESCTDMTAEEFHRRSHEIGVYATLSLTVVEQLPSSWFDESNEVYFYRCLGADGNTEVLLRDCIVEGGQVLRAGDLIRVWGESGGMESFCPGTYDVVRTLPCLNAAYCDLIG